MNNLFAILDSRFHQQFREAYPYYDDVCEADRPLPTEVSLFADIPAPLDPYRKLSDDAE